MRYEIQVTDHQHGTPGVRQHNLTRQYDVPSARDAIAKWEQEFGQHVTIFSDHSGKYGVETHVVAVLQDTVVEGGTA